MLIAFLDNSWQQKQVITQVRKERGEDTNEKTKASLQMTMAGGMERTEEGGVWMCYNL